MNDEDKPNCSITVTKRVKNNLLEMKGGIPDEYVGERTYNLKVNK